MLALLASLVSGSPPEPTSEDEVQRLVTRAQKGEQHAWFQLYRLHVQRVYRTVRPMCGSDAEAEDIVQESFIKAVGALNRYLPRPEARFVSWLMTIAVNTARKRLGRRRALPTPQEKLDRMREQPSADPTDEAIERAETELKRLALLQALSELDERERQVMTLRYGSDLTAREVSEAVKTSEANVRKICQRQRDRLLQRVTTLMKEMEERP